MYREHVIKHPGLYQAVLILFVLGWVVGHFAMNGLDEKNRVELQNYIQGFMKIFVLEKVDNIEVLKVSLYREFKQVLLMWALGLSIIGIPILFLTVFLRGFVLGFVVLAVFRAVGSEAIVLITATFVFKYFILIPAFFALAVNGVSFSNVLVQKLTGKKRLFENMKKNMLQYTFFTVIQLFWIAIALFIEAVFLPIFVKF